MGKRYKVSDVINGEFLKLPRALFANEKYLKLSSNAKIIYSLLLDRMSLSIRNQWQNENGDVYVIYKRDDICTYMGIGKNAGKPAFDELKKAGLIAEEFHGQGRPKLIYVYHADLSEKQATAYAEKSAEALRAPDESEEADGTFAPQQTGSAQLQESRIPKSGNQESLNAGIRNPGTKKSQAPGLMPPQPRNSRIPESGNLESLNPGIKNPHPRDSRNTESGNLGSQKSGVLARTSDYMNQTEKNQTERRGERAQARDETSPLSPTSYAGMEAIRADYISCCPSLPEPQPVDRWPLSRRTAIARLALPEQEIKKLFARVEQSDFLTGRQPGRDGSYFRASLDWIIADGHWQRILEGAYDNTPTQAERPSFDLDAYEKTRFDEVLSNALPNF